MPSPAGGLSRRTLLQGGAALGAGAALGLPQPLLAQTILGQGPPGWPELRLGLGQFMEEWVDSRRVANMVAALGWGEAEPQFLSRGPDSFISSRPADGDSLYRIYSMTKPITGMAAMMLVDEGLIALDQPIADFLPAFAKMQVQKVPTAPLTPDNLEVAVRPITIRHLLTHTAGLGYGIEEEAGPLTQLYRERGLVPGAVSGLEVQAGFRGIPAASLQMFADRLATLPLLYQPGTRWSYSLGPDLMGRIIEVVAGVPFDAFLQQRIFEPCGMTSTWFQVPRSEVERLTANYLMLGELLLPIDLAENSVFLDKPPFPSGGAGLVSSPRDYDRFLMMLAGLGAIEGRRVISEAAVRLGTSDLFPETLAPDDGFARHSGQGAGGRVGRGGEEGLFGWSGAAGTIGYVNLRSGLRAALYTQYMPAFAYSVQEDFLRLVAQAEAG
jgi:CubicO group peptidase (beta-lactamase class C family)